MKKSRNTKTLLSFYRKKIIAYFLALLMISPPMTLGASPLPPSQNANIKPGAINSGKVDMASGNLSFIEKIFDLKGYKLTLKYNSEGLYDKATYLNGNKPTGVAGLGWQLSKDRIVRLTHQTANVTDDEYILNAHGTISKLIFENESNDTLQFRLKSNPYWRIYFLSSKDQWIIQKQNGTQYIYGDGSPATSLISHPANSTETSIKWDNWVGSSVVVQGQESFSTAWNLAAIDDKYGDRVKLFYSEDKENIGRSTSNIKHTQASYLTKVVDRHGTRIELEYQDKTSDE